MSLSDDSKAVAFATLIPGASGLVWTAVFLEDRSMWNWYKGLKRAAWAIPGKHALVVHSLIDFATLMPLGYGAVQVWRYGGGLDYNDTCAAMASYAAVYGISMVFLPLMKKRSLAGCVLNMGALFGNSILMYQLFYSIYRPAANLVLPYSVATAYYALMVFSMWDLNEEETNK